VVSNNVWLWLEL